MSNHIRLRKGLNVPLKGEAKAQISKTISPGVVAVKPTDFKGFNPRLIVKEGDQVQAGTPLLIHKQNPNIRLCSPVSGKVQGIIRGAKRKLLAVTVEVDGKSQYISFETPNPRKSTKEEIIETLTQSGLWLALKQRPYGTFAN
ncbi:MAG: NADH:ubiquinone reductase (Na(+)-transporting) subunit A, partial [Bacteroidales bacterium]|nr:NADH:ubiquinone reductase (Na(+)-transporting) subunit A [Bacteroidales bacterium]